MAGRLVLDSGGVIGFARGDRAVAALIDGAARKKTPIIVPPIVVTETMRGGGRDTRIHRLLQTARVPAVGARLAREAGRLLGESGMSAAADAQVMAEALRAPCLLVTSDPGDMARLAAGRKHVRIMHV